MKTYRDLIVWQKAMALVTEAYKVTSSFPKDELFSLTSQMRRSSISIPSNISEGYGRQHKREQIRFFKISRGSIYELRTLIEISGNLNIFGQNTLNDLSGKCTEIEKMLNKLIYVMTQNTSTNTPTQHKI